MLFCTHKCLLVMVGTCLSGNNFDIVIVMLSKLSKLGIANYKFISIFEKKFYSLRNKSP